MLENEFLGLVPKMFHMNLKDEFDLRNVMNCRGMVRDAAGHFWADWLPLELVFRTSLSA